jgi:CheY-like chemotaxis protein
VAYAGREALDTPAHHDAEVVVLDMGMPGMDAAAPITAYHLRRQNSCRVYLSAAMTGRVGRLIFGRSPV